MQQIEVRAESTASRAALFDRVADFEGYPTYTEYLRTVRRVEGSGPLAPGHEYEFTLGWWMVTHTTRSRVTAVDSPRHLEWTLTRDLNATGQWRIEAKDDEENHLTFTVEFEPTSLEVGSLSVPGFVDSAQLLARVEPVLVGELRTILEAVIHSAEDSTRTVPVESRVERQ